MPTFSKSSMIKLDNCHYDLQLIAEHAIKIFDFSVICGNRSKATQDNAFYFGKSKLKYPNSKHNKIPSMAFDILPYPVKYPKDCKSQKEKTIQLCRYYYMAGIIFGVAEMLKEQGLIDHSVRWGGDWDRDTDFTDQTFNDLGHFELVK